MDNSHRFTYFQFIFTSILLAFLFFLTGCVIYAGYQPPFVPIRVRVDSTGDIKVNLSTRFVTPIGTFDVGTSTSIYSIQEQYESCLLIVKLDDLVTVYELNEDKDFSISFEDNKLYKEVSLRYDGTNNCDVILELETVSKYSTDYIEETTNVESSKTTKTDLDCPGAPIRRLEIGGLATVCTKNETVYLRTSPRKSASYTHRLIPGAEVLVIGEPICDERSSWWYWEIRTESGYEGWMAEGGDSKDKYFLCPK